MDRKTQFQTWAFDRWAVVPHTRQLLMDGEPIKLSGRAFDILVVLIERRGQLASKHELLETVWPGLVVEENNLHLHISALRKLLGHGAISTVPGRGYQFNLQIEGGLPSAEALPAAPPAAGGELPRDLPPLFGRDTELAALRTLLAAHRVVTVVGPGGIGKTRLALESARSWQARGTAPVCVVELSALQPGTPVAEAVALSLRVQLPGHEPAEFELAHLLCQRPLLLLLDNCEHRIEEVCALAGRISQHSDHVRILATSQLPLKTRMEQVFMLGPLAWPGDTVTRDQALRFGAVALFCARVSALQGEFVLKPDNLDDVAAICRRLEGLPLALELAAARVPLLGVRGLRARLDAAADGSLQLLTGGSRSNLPRHQTLHAAIDWSHSLLDDAQRRIFRRLGVFAGDFSLGCALDVLGDDGLAADSIIALLGALVERSLLVVRPGEPPRYRLLESTRAFALEQLRAAGEVEPLQRRRAQAMLRLFEIDERARWKLIPRSRIEVALLEVDNLRAALDWLASQAGEAELHIALAGACAWFWPRAALRREGLQRCGEALSRVGDATPAALEARLQLGCARLSHHRAEPAILAAAARAVELYRQLDDKLELFQALCVQAVLLSMTDDCSAGEAALDEMERSFDSNWPVWLWAPRIWTTGLCLGQWGRMDECSAVADQGLRMAQAVSEPAALAQGHMARAQCDAWMGHVPSAVTHGRTAIAMSRADGSRGRLGILLGDLSASLVELGQLDEAEAAAREAVALRSLNGTLWLQLDQLAFLALARGRNHEAAMALGRSDRCHAWSGGRRHSYLQRVHTQVQAPLQQALDSDALAALKAHGATLSDEAVAWLALGGAPAANGWDHRSDPLRDLP